MTIVRNHPNAIGFDEQSSARFCESRFILHDHIIIASYTRRNLFVQTVISTTAAVVYARSWWRNAFAAVDIQITGFILI